MAVGPVPGEVPAAAAPRAGALPLGGALLGLALPLVFLHVDWQPTAALPLGARISLSDAAVLAVAAGALAAGLARGFAPLRAARGLWVAAAAFLLFTLLATAYPLARAEPYAWKAHLVTALKYGEYALLAPALPLLLRARRDLRAALVALVAWSAAATAVGIAQFLGADVAGAWRAGFRQPSFLGPHDFAALSGAALAVGVAHLALRRERVVPRAAAATACAAGAAGFALGGSAGAVLGLVVGAAALLAVARARERLTLRRAAAAAGVVAVAAAGVLVIRGGDLGEFLRFAGVRDERAQTTRDVQSYSQHTVLAYIGLRIFADHPALGVGWQASNEEHAYGPYLADARRRFDVSPLALPSPEHPWGVQNAYVQALADLGIVGFLLFAAFLATTLLTAVRAALRAPAGRALAPALALPLVLLVMGTWTALGLVAGIPVDAVLWLGAGLAAVGAAAARGVRTP